MTITSLHTQFTASPNKSLSTFDQTAVGAAFNVHSSEKVDDLDPAPGEFVEELIVESLISVFASHGEEYVASNELVDDLAVCGEALEDDVLVVFKLDHHVPSLPVHVPSLHGGISPCLYMIPSVERHPHDPVEGDP